MFPANVFQNGIQRCHFHNFKTWEIKMILMSSGKPRGVSAKALKAEVDALLAKTKAAVAKRKTVAKPKASAAKPAAKASVAAKPVAAEPAPAPKPKSRGGRLIQMERELAAAKPVDHRCVYRGMKVAP
jgi:hypothetical protein